MKQKVILPAIMLLLSQSGISQKTHEIKVKLMSNCSDPTTPLSVNDFPNKVKVYPNPSKGELQIDVFEDGADLNMIDLNGKTVLKRQLDVGINEITLSKLEKGTYFIRIRLNETVRVSKLIVQ